ncbi:hypothetical protein [Mycobacterium colombiense]
MTIDPGNEIEILLPRRPAQSEALGQLMAHAEAMSAAKQLADALSQTDMVPKDYKGKPGNAAAAILYGAELGLDPIQSLQQIFVIHGSPAIYARTAVALVKRHGVIVETVSSDNTAVTVRATDPRTGQVETATWDIDRAVLAGYTSNAKYNTNPQEMLYAKAAMEVCRKIAPDVLLGVPYSREELDLEMPPQRVRSERVARGVDGLKDALGESDAATAGAAAGDAVTEQIRDSLHTMAPATRRKWMNRMFQLLNEADCSDRDDQLIVIAATAGLPVGELEHRDAISDDQLKSVVNELNGWAKENRLGQTVTDILNTATIRAAEAEQPTLDSTKN